MSRSLERAGPRQLVGAGVETWRALEVPPGHKYEIVAIVYGNDGQGNTVHYAVVTASGGQAVVLYWSNPTPVGKLFDWVDTHSFVLYPGDVLDVFLYTTGTVGTSAAVTYVDVDYSD